MPLILVSPYFKRLLGGGGSISVPEYDPYFNNVSILLNMENGEGGVATDLKGAVFTGTPRTSLEQKKFGSASLKLIRAVTSGLRVNDHAAMGFGSGSYCIEGWFYFKNITAKQYLFDARVKNGDFYSGALYVQNSKFCFEVGGSSDVYGNIGVSASGVLLNDWNHIALFKAADGRIYSTLNGKVISSYGVGSTNIGTTGNLAIGGDIFGNADSAFDGYVDEVRVTKGIARYPTSPFTPPATAFDRTGKRYQDWTVAWFAKSNNEDSSLGGTSLTNQNTHFKYDIPMEDIQKATRAAIAYFDSTQTGELTLTAMHSFPIPNEWKVKHPFNYPQLDKNLPIIRESDQAAVGDKIVRCGWNSFASLLTDAWPSNQANNTWGRIGIIGTDAPFYSGFGTHNNGGTDYCSLSQQEYSITPARDRRRFIILVK